MKNIEGENLRQFQGKQVLNPDTKTAAAENSHLRRIVILLNERSFIHEANSGKELTGSTSFKFNRIVT